MVHMTRLENSARLTLCNTPNPWVAFLGMQHQNFVLLKWSNPSFGVSITLFSSIAFQPQSPCSKPSSKLADIPFRSSSGIHWLRATWNPSESTSHVLSPGSFIHGGIPSTVWSYNWTQTSSNTHVSNTQASRIFDTSTLRCWMPPSVLRNFGVLCLLANFAWDQLKF